MTSESLFKESAELFPGGVNSPVRFYEPYPRFMIKGKGSRITDADGRSYIDHCLAFGPMILGHSNDEVKDAIKRQIDTGILYGAPSHGEISLGRIIREAVPSIEMMRFTNSGTEATMHAIRLARFFTGRDIILKVKGGFHGSHDAALSGSGFRPGSEPPLFSTVEVEYNNIDEIHRAFRQLGKRIAAFITEPVLGNVGVVNPDPEFLKSTRELTESYGSLLIFDEVITGFRSAFGGYQNICGVKPDLTTLGKIIGGGLPVGLFGGRTDIMENVAPRGKFYQQGTFAGNPLTMAAGYATLSVLRKMDYSIPISYTERLCRTTEDIMQESGIEVQVNRNGTMFTIFFTGEPVNDADSAMGADQNIYGKFFSGLLDGGLFVPKSQSEAWFTSFAHTSEDLEKSIAAIRSSAESLLR